MRYSVLLPAMSCLLVSGVSNAQTNSQVFVGDTIGHYVIDSFYSEPEKRIDLSDLRGKLVILDFWNVNCKACIASMPKIEKLQKKFGERIQFLLITKNSNWQIDNLFSRIKLRKPELPIATDRGLYSGLFPHEGDPLHVWIYPDGVVRHITEAYNTTKENIENALAGDMNLELSEREALQGFDPRRSLLEMTPSVMPDKITGYSLVLRDLYKYPNEVGVGIAMKWDSVTGNPIRIRALNYSIYRLFSLAYSKDLFDFNVGQNPPARNNWIVDETGDHLRFPEHSGEMEHWLKQNVVCYELRIPSERSCEFFEVMKQDVNRYFGYYGTIENRRVTCLVLKSKGEESRERSKNKLSQHISNENLQTTNKSPLFKQLVYSLQNLCMPVVSELRPDMKSTPLEGNLSDLTAIRKELKKEDLILVKEPREVRVLVIRKK